jgi:hypothetical protein
MSRWKWVRHDGDIYRDVGVDKDGSVHNPNGYPEDVVRAAVEGAEARRHARASEAAKRKDRMVYQVVQRLRDGGTFTPGTHCEICGRGLDDPDSKARGADVSPTPGIGSECWQLILAALEPADR